MSHTEPGPGTTGTGPSKGERETSTHRLWSCGWGRHFGEKEPAEGSDSLTALRSFLKGAGAWKAVLRYEPWTQSLGPDDPVQQRGHYRSKDTNAQPPATSQCVRNAMNTTRSLQTK
jgi:hypothetical protein